MTIPGLTTGDIGTESLTDAEEVQEMMLRMKKLTEEFRNMEMRKKLEDCLDSKVYNYRHREPFKPGEKVWFQNRESNAWFGPGVVVCYLDKGWRRHLKGGRAQSSTIWIREK